MGTPSRGDDDSTQGAGKCSIFILVAALYLASVEGKGHFCAYPKHVHTKLSRGDAGSPL